MRLLGLVLVLVVITCCTQRTTVIEERLSGAGHALSDWNIARAYPYGKIFPTKYRQGYQKMKEQTFLREENHQAGWTSLGPHNVAGRMLCLAFHPSNPDIIFAGSASGGLWKTTTAGRSFMQDGALHLGWEKVNLDHPVLAVASIAIDPENPDIIYAGTGEVYNNESAMPGVYNRFTRGTYGIGLLKSTDGGKSWDQVLSWEYQELTGVQDIVINPLNVNTIYACSTNGLYVSYNKGKDWSILHDVPMAVDFELNTADTNLLFVTHGSYLNNDVSGIFRSENGGKDFIKLENGLPANYSGRAVLKSAPSDPSLIYAYISDSNKGLGLYLSQNSGDDWSIMTNKDITKWQGWYAGDIAIKPDDATTVVVVGIDVHRSTNSGETMAHFSSWEAWTKGKVSILGDEGLDNYVHADIHKAYYHPNESETIFFATDGGIFVSTDNAENFEGRNGGLQTTQFYANFSNSSTDPNFAIGGLQDNATVIYDGTNEWIRVISGDGMCTAINNLDDNLVFASSQKGNILRSTDRGKQWFSTGRPTASETVSFNVPYELAPSDPSIVYIGGQHIHISENNGSSWRKLTEQKVDGNNSIVSLAVAPTDPSLLYITTSPSSTRGPKLLKSNGGIEWEEMKGLPDRLAMDVAIHPNNSNIVYVVYSGFNTQHIFKTTNGGADWFAIDLGLADIPTNTVVIDPNEPDNVYFGTDLGIIFTPDGGTSWQHYQDGLPDVIMAMHLSISPSNNKLRVATHGNGVYEGDLVSITTKSKFIDQSNLISLRNYPNPVRQSTTFEWEQKAAGQISLKLLNTNGQILEILNREYVQAGKQKFSYDLGELLPGNYFYILENLAGNKNEGFAKGQLIKM